MTILLIVGTTCALAGLFVKFNFWVLLPAVCFSVTFGMVIYYGSAVVMDKINNVVYSGGNFSSVISYLVMLGIASVISIAACYIPEKK